MSKTLGVLLACALLAGCDNEQPEDSPLDVSGMSVTQLRKLLDEQKTTSVKLIERLLVEAENNGHLNAFITVDAERALLLAAEADRRRASNGTVTPLLGVPIVVKDNIHVAGIENTAGTPALRGFVPETGNAVVEKLQLAGAIVLAKTNMHELAFGITSDNAAFGAVGNPYDVTRFAGGSSGGTAAAIAAGLAPVGLGTDTGGSVRIPAALTGIVGFRPSSGRYDSSRVTPISSTRDTVGIMALNVADVILIDGVVMGDPSGQRDAESGGLRLGVPRAYFYENLDAKTAAVVESALRKLAAAGVTLVEADIEGIEKLLAQTTFPIALYEVVRELPAYLETHNTGVSYAELVAGVASADVKGVFGMLADGGPIDEQAYAAAMAAREQMSEVIGNYFVTHDLDAYIFPTTLLPAQPIEGSGETVSLNGADVPTFATYIHNTEQATIAGLPSVSLPAGLTASGLPVGLDIEAPAGADRRLLAIAATLESLLRVAGDQPAPVSTRSASDTQLK